MSGTGISGANTRGVAISDLAGQVLDLVRAAVGTAGEAEVVVDDTEQALTRFANSFIHQNVADATISVQLRLHHDGRTATGSTTVIDTDGLTQLVDRTAAATRLSPPDLLWPGLARPAPVASRPPVDEDTAHAQPVVRAERVRAFVDATEGLEAAGYCSTLRWSMAFANSAGHTAAGRGGLGIDGRHRASRHLRRTCPAGGATPGRPRRCRVGSSRGHEGAGGG